jgi:DNA-binding CsgD family transcriptional regulator
MARAEGMLDAFDWLGHAAVLVGRDGQVIELNREARRHLGTSIQVVRGQLTASARSAKERLQELVGTVVRSGRGKPSAASTAVLLPQPGKGPVVACAAPIPRAWRDGLAELGGIILLLDPGTQSEPAESLLREAFGFTRAEIRIAQGLAKGYDLQSIAARHKVSVGTLRVQLKSMFAKTNTKRQAELVMLFARLALHPK